MTTPRASQFGEVTVEQASPPALASQFGIISIQQDAPTISPSNCSQFGCILVIGNNKQIISLGPVTKLPCWQPCTAYGTYSHVIRFK